MNPTAPAKTPCSFEDPAKPWVSVQLVTVLSRGAKWSTIRTRDGREFTVHTVCLS